VLFHDGAGAFTRVDVQLAPGSGPSAIAAADFNGDTFIDLAVTNELNNTITVLFNNNDRSFDPQAPIPTGGAPGAITAVDLDDELGPDIAVASALGGGLWIYRNLGGGAFGAPTIVPTGPTPSSVDPADIDNDKDFDLVVGNSGGGTVSLVVNNGGGAFAPAVNLPVDGNPAQTSGALASWDMDSDGDTDLVAVVNDDNAQTNVIRILRNDSTPGQVAFTLFNPIGAGEDPRLVRGADVTGDLLEDLVAVNVQQLPLALGPPSPSSSLSIRPNLVLKKPQIPGDTNGDGMVNIDDLLVIINNWGQCPVPPPPCNADIHPAPTGNGVVDIDDLLLVINNWMPPG
jgi:hypothetical protein